MRHYVAVPKLIYSFLLHSRDLLNISAFSILIYYHRSVQNLNTYSKGKGKVFYGQEPPSGDLLPQNVGSIINYLQWCTEVAQWRTPSHGRPEPATVNGVRDSRSNWLEVTLTLHRTALMELLVLHDANDGYKSENFLQRFRREHATLEYQANALLSCAAGHSGYMFFCFLCCQTLWHYEDHNHTLWCP